jgi:phosphate transport system protein
MAETRRHYHEELAELEAKVQAMGAAAQAIFSTAVASLSADDIGACDAVIASDDKIDDLYLDIERRILDVFALQTPVASDLRLLTVLLHVNLHLERIGDMAVNLAKISKLAWGLPRNAGVTSILDEMGGNALKMVGAAMDAFARRDLALARRLPTMDEPIDRLNRGMLQEILAIADDKRVLEWGIRMHVVSRQIERVGDHAVDIGEQVAFLITGEFHEFTDASHSEIESALRATTE